jgi:hypothetical protein
VRPPSSPAWTQIAYAADITGLRIINTSLLFAARAAAPRRGISRRPQPRASRPIPHPRHGEFARAGGGQSIASTCRSMTISAIPLPQHRRCDGIGSRQGFRRLERFRGCRSRRRNSSRGCSHSHRRSLLLDLRGHGIQEMQSPRLRCHRRRRPRLHPDNPAFR